MRKGNVTILASIFVMALVAAGIGAGTLAYFSDVETSEGNVFVAGTIDLSIEGVEHVEMEDLKPCETGYIIFVIYNDGTNPMHVWKHILNVETYENEVIEPEYEYYIAHGIDPLVGKNDIDTVILYDMWIDIDEVEGFDPAVDILVIDEAEGLHIDDVECFYIYLGVLEPADYMVVVQSYHMEAETENWAQSDVMEFDVEFHAGQIGGPVPGIELAGHERP